MRRFPAPGVLICMLLVLCSQAALGDIILEKEEFSVGEQVRITIRPALQDQMLIILAPNATYRFIGGIAEDTTFIAQQPGMHIVRLLDTNNVVETASFIVNSTQVAETDHTPLDTQLPLVSETTVSTGSPIIINAPLLNVHEVAVLHDGSRFVFNENVRPLTYIPAEPGSYEVLLLYVNGTQEQQTVAVTGKSDPFTSTAPAPELPRAPFSAPAAGAHLAVKTANSEVVNADLVWRREDRIIRQSTAATFDPQTLDAGTFDLEMRTSGRMIKSVQFRGLKYNPGFRLGLEEPLPAQVSRGLDSAIETFAIDPSALEFDSAHLTFTATGYALYKCAQYNFSTRTCFGEHVKIMDLVPGQEYSIEISNADPLFSQTGYLANPNFDTNTASWTTQTISGNAPAFSWVASDAPQSGVAQSSLTSGNRVSVNQYYQSFTLTIPSGTALMGLNFSALWRISTYSNPGSVSMLVQNSARTTTYCNTTRAFSAATSWASIANTTGSGGCSLASFTPGTVYTIALRCSLATASGGGSTETCRWDNASVIVWYNDTTAPVLRSAQDAPDPVNFAETINVSVNVTDNIGVYGARVEILGVNYTMLKGAGDIYYFDGFSTARTPGIYFYKLYANDTNNNWGLNTSNRLNFTIRDINKPIISLLGPDDSTYTANTSFAAYYSLSDQVGVNNCTLNVSGLVRNSTLATPLGTTLNLTSVLPTDGVYFWNITCNDTSGNRNISETRNITRDTLSPVIYLNTPNATLRNNPDMQFNFTPQDANLLSCTLWGNWSGVWAANQTVTPVNNAANLFEPVTLPQGRFSWNVRCMDRAGNQAFNTTNRTVIIDLIPPNASGISISPASDSAYSLGSRHQFNITWTDSGSSVDTVLLETDVSGTLANVTTSRIGNIFNYTFANLSAGSYSYRWYANDTAGNWNSTDPTSYVVAKATPLLNLTINRTHQNWTVPLNAYINITGWMITPSLGAIELYKDGVLINSSNNYATSIVQLTIEKRYNITLVYPATQNYSEGRLTLFADVVDTTPPHVILDTPLNNSLHSSSVTFFFTPHDTVDVGNCSIILDDRQNATKDVPNAVQSNITIAGLADGTHNWTVNCTDLANNSDANSTKRTFIVDTQPPTPFDLANPPSGTISSDLSPVLSWTQTTDSSFDNYTLLIDNDVNFGSVNYLLGTSPATNTSAQVTLIDQIIWYWKVIAYDGVGNLREAGQVFNYTADAQPPTISSISPANNTHTKNAGVVISYTPSDFTSILNCSLFIDGSRNQSNSSVQKDVPNTFAVALAEGDHTIALECYDAAKNRQFSPESVITVDLTPPTSFVLTNPANDTLSSNATPTYVWLPTTELHFANYTVQVSDREDFANINYTFATFAIDNTSTSQNPALSDGTWYWRVIAYDRAGNERIMHPVYKVDTTPPSPFALLSPANDTQQRVIAPTVQWEQTTEANFKNYTVIFSDDPSFSYLNHTNATLTKTDTSAIVKLNADAIYYWRVIAYDLADLFTNSTDTFTYLADFKNPNVTATNPANNTVVTTSSLVTFSFRIEDMGSISSCSLYIDDLLDKTIYSPAKGTTLGIASNLENGDHRWYVSCADVAGNIGNSTSRNITLSVVVPTQTLYESSPGTTNYAAAQTINLSYSQDGTENQVSFSVAGGAVATAVNAVHKLNGSGMLLFNNTQVNFSGVFAQSNNNVFYVTWKLLRENSSGSSVLCQAGNDNTGGTAIGSTVKKTLTGSCSYTAGDILLASGENLSLEVTLYNSGGSARTFTHYWEGTSVSSVAFKAYKLGLLNASFASVADPAPSEGAAYIEQCQVSCNDGTCLNTEVYLQMYNGTAWKNISNAGNITLNGTQVNPVSLGNLNRSMTVNFSLYGSLHSYNNSLRCFATSTYSENTGSQKNVSVIDRLAPAVTLLSPSHAAAFEPQSITFSYTPLDLRLDNCSLWGNWSGTWRVEEMEFSPANDTTNSFTPVALTYGVYKWNVQCHDRAKNHAFATQNYTLTIAGDVMVESSTITFSVTAPVEGETITIYANITNRATKAEPAVNVEFYDGDPGAGGLLIGTRTIALPSLSNVTTSTPWTATTGLHQIYLLVDPPLGSGNIIESDETNNIANQTLLISTWQLYYGNITGQFVLGKSSNDTFVNWTLTNHTGNIYIADSDATNGIKFQFLQAIGRNTSGGTDASTTNDFGEIDTILATSTYVDSISKSFTSGGEPLQTAGFEVYGKNISSVPVIDSSTDGNFTTGLLWDTDDSSNAYYDGTDKEDLVFVTRINDNLYGVNGFTDYEIRIPAQLRDYKGTTSTVSFYYEIQ